MPKPQLDERYRDALRSQPGPLCVAMIVNGQAVMVCKLPRAEAEALRGQIGIGYRSELGLYEAGAVIRLVIDFYDQPDAPMTADTFLNVADNADLRVVERLAAQNMLDIHLFDPRMDYLFTKRIPFRETPRRGLTEFIRQAIAHNKKSARPDFPAAKAAMMRDTEGK